MVDVCTGLPNRNQTRPISVSFSDIQGSAKLWQHHILALSRLDITSINRPSYSITTVGRNAFETAFVPRSTIDTTCFNTCKNALRLTESAVNLSRFFTRRNRPNEL